MRYSNKINKNGARSLLIPERTSPGGGFQPSFSTALNVIEVSPKSKSNRLKTPPIIMSNSNKTRQIFQEQVSVSSPAGKLATALGIKEQANQALKQIKEKVNKGERKISFLDESKAGKLSVMAQKSAANLGVNEQVADMKITTVKDEALKICIESWGEGCKLELKKAPNLEVALEALNMTSEINKFMAGERLRSKRLPIFEQICSAGTAA